MSEIRIGDRFVGHNHPAYFIADVAANHDGDLSRAFRLIELAKQAGADAAKFQNFVAPKIVSEYGFRCLAGNIAHQKRWDKSVVEVYSRASIPQEWNEKLKGCCDEVGIEYFTSPYDFESVDQVDPYLSVYKIGSGDITWLDLVSHIARKGKPVLIATGASNFSEVKRAMSVLRDAGVAIGLMQCNTNYTGSQENFNYINLNVLNTYRVAFSDAVLGLSDHTEGDTTVLGAVALGARIIEKHFTDDKRRKGPDHSFSMDPESWKEMVLRVRDLESALGDGHKRIERNESETAIVQRRALYFRNDCVTGSKITQSNLIALRPRLEGSVSPDRIDSVLGKTLNRSKSAGDCLLNEDFN
jgi:sialic acid synthase SpsE